MNKNKFLYATIFMVATFLNAEISAFDAGNVNSNSPYGLTENEQVLLSNSKKVDSVQMNLNDTKESLEGLRTVLEGTNSQISNLENRVADLEVRATGKVRGESELDQMKQDIAWLKSQINEINKKLGSSVKKNTSEVSKSTSNAVSTGNFKSKKPADISKEADSLYSKKSYNEAKARYEYLISQNYKPAKANYMLGEIAYFSGSYGNAINLYKKSISYNEKGDYTPRLLYHTAISFDKIGDSVSGTKFFNALKASYPNSPEAKQSPSRK